MSNPNEWLDLVQDGLKQVAITEKLAKATQELTMAREKELYAVEGMGEGTFFLLIKLVHK